MFVLPGFATSDHSTALLRGFLSLKGYKSRGWGLGTNLGLGRAGGLQNILRQFDDFRNQVGGPVSLVGWSMGGVYARQIAHERPDDVRQLISLGSPIANNPQRTAVWRLHENVDGKPVSTPVLERFLANDSRTPVPATSIYSRTDAVVPWHSSREPEHAFGENIEVETSHVGLGFSPAVYYLLADRLGQRQGEWRKFDRDASMNRMVLSSLSDWPLGTVYG